MLGGSLWSALFLSVLFYIRGDLLMGLCACMTNAEAFMIALWWSDYENKAVSQGYNRGHAADRGQRVARGAVLCHRGVGTHWIVSYPS